MTGRRRLSFTSNLQSQQELWEKTFGSKQQIIAVQMFFDEGAPSREEMMDIAKTLCTRFVRLRSIPVDTGCGSSREWVDVSDVDAAIDKIVAKRNLQPETEKEARIFLEKVKGQDILTSIDGIEVPLWRCYVVGDRSLVWLFDHAIGDGLSLSTLLAVVATSSPDGPPLALEDVSPAMKRILDAGIRSICFRTPLPLLWLPNTVRAVRALLPAFVAKPDNDTPLHPYRGAAIPQESFGTIYFLPLSLSLCTALAKTAQVTINDILLTCVYGTICNYFSLIHFEPVSETMQHLMPIGVPKAPSFYLDEWEGLNVQLAPALLSFSTKRLSFRHRLQMTHQKTSRVKRSNVGVFMQFCMNHIASWQRPETVFQEMKGSFSRYSFVYSNVPGPTDAVYIAGRQVKEIQALVSNPLCMIQTISYNGTVFTNAQVDLRSTVEADKLSSAFVATVEDAVREILQGDERMAALSEVRSSARAHNPGPFHM